ncbi:MAG: hypothetical protein ACKO6H_03815 [Betaproteobacteria bacterium]
MGTGSKQRRFVDAAIEVLRQIGCSIEQEKPRHFKITIAVVPLVNGLVSQLFGVRCMATLTGVAFLSHQLGSFLDAWGGGLIYDAKGNYDMAWQFAVGIGVLAGLFQLGMNTKAPIRLGQTGLA